MAIIANIIICISVGTCPNLRKPQSNTFTQSVNVTTLQQYTTKPSHQTLPTHPATTPPPLTTTTTSGINQDTLFLQSSACQQEVTALGNNGSLYEHLYDVPCDREDVRCFVKVALRPWARKSGRIHKTMIDTMHAGKTKGEFCSLVQIINNQLFYHAPLSEHLLTFPDWLQSLYKRWAEAVLDLFFRVMAQRRLPDTELVFCIGDCVSQHNARFPDVLDDKDMLPAFNPVMCHGSASIPIPMFDLTRPPDDVSLQNWPSAIQNIIANRNNNPWPSRKDIVVFRGNIASCAVCASSQGLSTLNIIRTPDTHDNCGRKRASKIANDIHHSRDFDFGRLGNIDMPAHETYRYVQYIHGNCNWANRLRRLLFMGTALFKQAGVCEEFYALRLRPWTHYIPVDYNLVNMTAALAWVRAHPADTQRIIENMHSYAHAFNTAEFAVQYTTELLITYAQLLSYNVVLRPRAILLTVSSPLLRPIDQLFHFATTLHNTSV
jgi:hypothetical protein